MLIFLAYFMCFCCFLNFMVHKHFISLLLSLEFILVTIFLILMVKQMYMVSLLMVSLGACEGALGLSLLMSLSSMKNNYFMNNLSLMKC